MNEIAIRAENIGKCYKISHAGKGMYAYKSLRDSMVDAVKLPFKRTAELLSGKRDYSMRTEDYWALKDLSFEIKKGDVVGIIGRNGAGKSTLLKILSRITAPTTGKVELFGRVGSLLEVGTGFHPELTGRENIFLNGAILGMRRQEILKNYDNIVAFAEIEKFLDTPVKHYSSGMYMRLAFSVAAHLEPEILLVDEVLAVGDAAFQKKCLGKMSDISNEGRTIFFVSHNMSAVQKLCRRCIFLEKGQKVEEGNTANVIAAYLNTQKESGGEATWDISNAPGDDIAKLNAVRVVNEKGETCTRFDVRDSLIIEICYWVFSPLRRLDVSIYLSNERGERVFVSMNDCNDLPGGERDFKRGFYRSLCKIPGDFLNEGRHFIQVSLTDSHVHTIQRDIVSFSVTDEMRMGGARGNYLEDWTPSTVRPKLEWKQEIQAI